MGGGLGAGVVVRGREGQGWWLGQGVVRGWWLGAGWLGRGWW